MTTLSHLGDIQAALTEFYAALPGWWWSAGDCQVSRDASCGPHTAGQDADLLRWRLFDRGFRCDDRGDDWTVADSIREVTRCGVRCRDRMRRAIEESTKE